MLFLNQSASLYASYYALQISVHRPFIPSPRKPSSLTFPSLAICTNAARSCIHVLDLQYKRAGSPAFANVVSGYLLFFSYHSVRSTPLSISVFITLGMSTVQLFLLHNLLRALNLTPGALPDGPLRFRYCPLTEHLGRETVWPYDGPGAGNGGRAQGDEDAEVTREQVGFALDCFS